MKVTGSIFTGVMRGEPLVEMFRLRIAGMIGYEPFPGTLDIKLDKEIDIKSFATKCVEHVLLNGAVVVDIYLVPARLNVQGKGSADVWIARQGKSPYRNDVLEIISKDSLRKQFSLRDGDDVEVEFLSLPKRKSRLSEIGDAINRSRGHQLTTTE